MRDQLLFAASAIARVVLVMVAFGLAVGSIGLVSVRGFCPEVGDSAALAAPSGTSLATIVEEPEDVDPNSPAPDEQAPAEDNPADQEPPTDEAPEDGTEDGAEDGAPEDGGGACPGGVQRCLPPLWSSVLILGETACHDQAPAHLRSALLPSFVGATVLLAGAWWLRPSRLHDRQRNGGPDRRREDSTTGPTGSRGSSGTPR